MIDRHLYLICLFYQYPSISFTYLIINNIKYDWINRFYRYLSINLNLNFMKTSLKISAPIFTNKILSLIFLVALLFVFACNNDDDSPEGFITDRLNYNEVVSSTKIATLSGSDFGVSAFEYENDRVSSVTEISEFSDGEDYSSYSEDTYTLNYSSEGLESVLVSYFFISSFNGQTDTTEFSFTRSFNYNSKGQVNKVTISSESFDEVGEINYSYDNEGNLEKIDEGDGYFQLIEWVNKNVSIESSWYNEDDDNSNLRNLILKKRNKFNSQFLRQLQPEKGFENKYSGYDDKVNPLGILSIIYSFSNGLFISQNNPTELNSIYYNSDGSVDETTTNSIEYEYNSQGLPTKYMIGGDEPETLFITYK